MSSAIIISALVKSGKSSARAQVEAALQRIDNTKKYNALISVITKRSLDRADEIDSLIRKGEEVGPLAGVPFVAKDNMMAFGAPTTAASRLLENFISPVQATAIEKLESAGAICIGKTNLDAFAHGGSTENSAFGPTRNAIDPSKVSGGSSGGSAVATALDVVPFALGTDTGGSIRQPASFNGVVGVKPTYGTVSRYGVIAMASSTDSVGFFTKDLADADLILGVMAGRDDKDMTTLPDFFAPSKLETKLRIGIIKEFMSDGTDQGVKKIINDYAERLIKSGHTVVEVSLPIMKYALAMYYVIVPAEISSNMARFDGVRFGRQPESANKLDDLIGQARDDGFMAENKRRIMIGSYVLSSGYYDAYYLKAQKARTLLTRAFDEVFRSHDMLIGPVSPTTAFAIGEKTSDPVKMYLSDIMTVPASLVGLPAVSVPGGVSSDGLPVGVQLIGPRRGDALLLALAKSMEIE